MADIVVRIIGKDEYTAELQRLNAELGILRNQQAAVNELAARVPAISQARALGELQTGIGAVTGKIEELNSAYFASRSAAEAIGDRMKVPFAAAGREIDSTIASIDRLIAAQTTVGGISLARGPAAAVGGGLFASVIQDLEKVQNETAKAAHGIGIAFSSTRIPPTLLNSVRKELEETQSTAARVAHGVGIAFSAAPLGATQLSAAARGIREISAAHIGLEQSAGRSANAMRGIGHAANEGTDVAAVALRKLTNLGDELARGQRGQIVSTIISGLRELGLLGGNIIQSLATPWGAFAAAGVAALAAVGYEAEQAFQRFRSLRDTANELALGGFGAGTGAIGPAIPENIAGEFDRIKAETNDYAGSVKNVQEELNKLPPAAQGARREFTQLAEGIAGLRGEAVAKALEPLVKNADQGAQAFAKYLTETLKLQGATTDTGQTLEEFARSTASSDDAIEKLIQTAIRMREATLNAGRAGHEASNSVFELGLAAGLSAEATGGAGPLMEAFAQAVQKSLEPLKNVNEAASQLTKTQRDQNDAIAAGNSNLDKRITLLQKLASAQSAAAGVEGPSPEGELGAPGGERIRRAREASRNLQVEVQNAPLPPGQEEQLRVERENIRARAEARREDLAAQARAAQERLDLARREEAQRITAGRQEAGLPNLPQAELNAQVEATSRIAAARDAAAEANRRVQDQELRTTIDRLTAERSEEARGAQERIAIQDQIIAKLKEGLDAGRVSEQTYQNAIIERARLVQQEQIREAQSARDEARIAVEAAKGQADSVDKITQAWDRYRAKIESLPGASKVEITQSYREELRDLQSEQAKAFSQITEFNSGAAKLGNLQIEAAKARFETEVAAHGKSKEQEAEAEANFTNQVISEQTQRIEQELQLNDLTVKQKQQLYQTLADLYEKDAVAQEQAQKKITAAIEAENKKRIQAFTQLFDTAGSAFERFLTEGLARSTTRGQALQELGRSLIGGVVKTAGSLASEYAGKAIGPELGLTEEQSKGGLGEVLGNALAKSLGLLKEAPKDKANEAAALMQKAVAAQEKATGSFATAVENYNKSVTALNGFRSKFGEDVGKFGSAVDKYAAQKDTKESSKTSESATRSEPRRDNLTRDQVAITANHPCCIPGPCCTAGDAGSRAAPTTTMESIPTGSMSASAKQPSAQDIGQAVSSPQVRDLQSWLQTQGYTAQASAAVLGNAQQESGFNPTKIGKAGELGLFQELDDRRKNLESYAASSGRSATDPTVQMEFMDKELQKIDSSFKTSTESASVLAKRFSDEFERPDPRYADIPARQRNAENIFASQGASAPASNIIDETQQLGFGNKFGQLQNVQGFVIHHTGGGQNIDDVLRTFQERNVASQFVVGRQGQVYQTLPDQARGQHIIPGSGLGFGLSNQNTMGVEVIAKNDRDVNAAQIAATQRLVNFEAQKYGFDPATQVFGHGEVNPGHKDPTEGFTIANAIRGVPSLTPTGAAVDVQNRAAMGPEVSEFGPARRQDYVNEYGLPQQPGDTVESPRQQQSFLGRIGVINEARAGDAPQLLAEAVKRNADVTQQNNNALQNTTTALGSNSQIDSQNTQASQQLKSSTDQAAQAYKSQPSQGQGTVAGGSTTAASSSSGDVSSGVGELVSGFKGLAGAVGGVLPGFRILANGIGTVQSVFSSFNTLESGTKAVTTGLGTLDSANKLTSTATTTLQTANLGNTVATTANTLATQTNSAAESAAAAGSAAGGVGKAAGGLLGLGFLGLERGGIVPSAAGGMIVGGTAPSAGQLAILHPREMVLPAHISEAIQSSSMMKPGDVSVADWRPSFQTLAAPSPTNVTGGNSTLTYAPTISSRGFGMSRTELQSILRTHGDMFETIARNMMRNSNGLFRN